MLAQVLTAAGVALVFFALGWGLKALGSRRPGRGPSLASRLPQEMTAPTLDADLDVLQAEDVFELDTRDSELRERALELDKRAMDLEQRELGLKNARRGLEDERRALDEERRHVEAVRAELQAALLRAAELSPQDAERRAMRLLERRMEQEAARKGHALMEQTRRRVREEAQRLIAIAAARMAPEAARDIAQSDFHLPTVAARDQLMAYKDTFESETGAALLLEEGSLRLVLSCMDSRRREIVRRVLERMAESGDFSPEAFGRLWPGAFEGMDEADERAGHKAADEALGRHHARLHREVYRALGRLRFIRSQIPNAQRHGVETAGAAAAMALELGLPEGKARLAGLLHGIGQALVLPGPEGPPARQASCAEAGASFLLDHGLDGDVAEAVRNHHLDSPPTALGALTAAASAMVASRSFGRRGAGSDAAAQGRRMERAEHSVRSVPGVRAVYAFPAFNEIRVIVSAAEVNDAALPALAENIARRLRDELKLEYDAPHVTVLRETHAVAYV